MAACTVHQLGRFVEAYGWLFDSESENVLVTGWEGDGRHYPLQITTSDTMVSFEVSPLMVFDIDWLRWPELLLFILELNEKCQIVRLSVNEHGEVILQANVLAEDFHYNHFSNLLGMIGYYADALYGEILSKMTEMGYHLSSQGDFLTQ